MSRYATPEALKAALEARLRRNAQETGRELNRLRMCHLIFCQEGLPCG